MKFKKIRLSLNIHSYDIVVGQGVTKDKKFYKKFVTGKEVLIISDANVPKIKLKQITSSIKDSNPIEINTLELKLTEKNKDFSSVSRIHNILIQKKYTRDSLIICIGGGILSDVSGFAAATYLRGINFILMPSTLLSQVDASVGGKTAINNKKGKNLIGAFHQPTLVLADIDLLKSLGRKQISEGYSEIIKHSLIKDKKLFYWLEKKFSNQKNLNNKDLIDLIYRSIRIKADIVEQDEKEVDIRALLNFGHTFGHAFELLGNYKTYSHGEGVALGIIAALRISQKYFSIANEEIEKVSNLLLKVGLIIKPKQETNFSKLYKAMEMDKKRTKSSLRFVLLQNIGSAVVKENISKQSIIKSLKETF